MKHVQLFILFQEHIPSDFFYKPKQPSTSNINSFFQDLDTSLACIETENYKGFYDIDNIKTFLANYSNDDYPVYPQRKLRSSLKNWKDWKEQRESNPNEVYKIERTPTKDNSFGEIHARQTKDPNNKYLLVSCNSICFTNRPVNVEKTKEASIVQVECRELKKELKEWFNKNRIPPRTYHPSPKHGENGKGEWKNASKLLCSHLEAEDMLHKAIGINGIDELYYFDKKHKAYIIFRSEGNIGKLQFHAYHLSTENSIPEEITNLIKIL